MSAEHETESIRRLNEEDFEALFRQQARAYPTFFRAEGEQLDRIRDHVRKSLTSPTVAWYGLYENDRLAASMRLHDFLVCYRGVEVPAGGVGAVAVDLTDKKRRLAKALMENYIDHYRRRPAPLGLLWPFRPDFYHKMGFGYGGKVHRYTVPPESLPDSPFRKQVRYLSGDDQQALADCYHRYARALTGLVAEPEGACPRFILEPLSQERVVGFERDGVLEGFLLYQFGEKEKTNFLEYDLQVTRLITTTPASLAALLGFLRAQADQVRRVIVDTADDNLHYLLSDPRDGSRELVAPITHVVGKTGIGIMYRVFDIPAFFAATSKARYGDGPCTVTFEVTDSFVPANAGAYTLRFADGHAALVAEPADTARVELDIAEFSSLLMGAVSLSKLAWYGKARVSDESVLARVDDVLHLAHPPICLHPF